MKRIDAAIAVVTKDSKVLICQRLETDTFGGLWEFPGGKQEAGETLEQCLARELMEELQITARPMVALPVIEHNYPHVNLRLHPFLCVHESGEPQLIECQQARWVTPRELRGFQFPPANEGLIERVIRHMETPSGDGIENTVQAPADGGEDVG